MGIHFSFYAKLMFRIYDYWKLFLAKASFFDDERNSNQNFRLSDSQTSFPKPQSIKFSFSKNTT